MKKQRLKVIQTLVAGLALAVLLPGAQNTKPDEARIREVVARYLATREQRDASALAALFTTDADQLVSSGEWRKGRDAIVRGTLASSEATGGKRQITIETVRFLGPAVALADGPYEMTNLIGGIGGEKRKMWSTFVMMREKDGWRIAAIRNMRPAVAGAIAK